jgi:3-oxoacyl-[acyl-carrier protein] reductase
MMEIRGKRVIITGGCGGIALGIAKLFAELDKRVILVDRNIEPGLQLAQEFSNVECIQLDMSDHQAVETRLGPLLNAEDSPEILVNAVGWSPKYDADGKPWKPWTIPMDHWREVVSVNVEAPFNMCRLALPKMIERRYGRIINIGSVVARNGGGVAPLHYVTSKAAVLGLTIGVAKDVAEFGITVNAVNPGRIDTPMIHDVSEETNRFLMSRIPLGRFGRPRDVAGSVAFLASDYADYITGTAIEVNGGLYVGP